MAKDKGKNILTGPPMNSSSRSWAFGEPHGCDGIGCASDMETWPLHHVYRRGERCRLCSSCILLSHRSAYCCCCFFLVTSPWEHYDESDPLRAPPAPTVTCQVCRDAVAHVCCLYPADGVFVCPACRAEESGRPFTYAPPCRVPLDPPAARVLVLAARMALAHLKRQASEARAEAERLSQVAIDARTRAYSVLGVAFEMDTPEPDWYFDPHRVVVPPEAQEEGGEANSVDAPQPPNDQDHLAASEGGIQANMEDAMPPLAALTIGNGDTTAVAMAHAGSSHTPRLLWPLPPFGAYHYQETITAAGSSRATPTPVLPPPPPPPPSPSPPSPPPSPPSPPRALNFFGVRQMAMAAAEAARASPPTPPTLQLFPITGEASGSSKMPRTMQLFQDEIPDEDEEM